jgi:Virulence factor
MATYQILYWQDIPAQIKVFEAGRRPISRPLPVVFQERIDARAMSLGLTGTEAYLEQWHWSEKHERPETAEELLKALVEELGA